MGEILKVLAASTPFWTAVVVVIIFFALRKVIADLVGRVQRFGALGTSLEAHERKPLEQQTQTRADDAILKAKHGEAEGAQNPDPVAGAERILSQISKNAYVNEREQTVRGVLKEFGVSRDPQQTERVLVAVAASALVSAEFERVYNSIWGSQIEMLQYLNASVPSAREQVMPYYQAAALRYPDTFKAYPFEDYMKFLTGQGLVTESGGRYAISLKGRTFLLYLVHEGKLLNRVG